jgi:hypothetical protein
MEYIKKLHETVEILETLLHQLSQLSQESHANFSMSITSGYHPDTPKSLVITYIFFIYSLLIVEGLPS